MKENNQQEKKENKLVDNKMLKTISGKRIIVQPIYIFIVFILLSCIIYLCATESIIDSLSSITTVNLTLFAVNLALLVFIVPYFINDKIKHIETREQIKEYKIQGKVRQAHLEQLKKIDVRIISDSQILNLLYFQTIILVLTFCISVVFLAFFSNINLLLVTAVNSSHIVTEIIYILNLLPALGLWMHTKNIDKIYADMISYESNLLNNSGSIVHVFTDKEIKEIKRKIKKTQKGKNVK